MILSNKLIKSFVKSFFSLSAFPSLFIFDELVDDINNLFFNSSSSVGINLTFSFFWFT